MVCCTAEMSIKTVMIEHMSNVYFFTFLLDGKSDAHSFLSLITCDALDKLYSKYTELNDSIS